MAFDRELNPARFQPEWGRAPYREPPVDVRCIGCGKKPEELGEYSRAVLDYPTSWTPTDYVRRQEGTYNRANGHFACDLCYISMGMPAEPAGSGRRWVAP